MRDKLKSYWGIILTAVLFVFGTLGSIIGWQAADKLNSIDKTLQKLEGWFYDEKKVNSDQGKDIEVLKSESKQHEKSIEELKQKKF